MTKAAGYLRVSGEGQIGEDKYGLAAQREAVETYAKAQGYEVAEWYVDEAISGATLDRPELTRLLNDAGGKFAFVIVAKMDRIARDLMAQLWIEKELLRGNVELISVAEPFRGQDPANVLFRQVIGAFAQFERARIAERMAGGRKQKARGGGYAGGGAPIGYTAEKGAKVLSLDAEKAETVRRLFELREECPGASLEALAGMMNAEGLTTAQGAIWRKAQVKRVLDRRDFYAGTYTYAGIKAEGKHEAIV
jgi:DNA invertase Pin-like site-specific DNA recombinase